MTSVNTESKFAELQMVFGQIAVFVLLSVIHHQVWRRMRATEVIVLLYVMTLKQLLGLLYKLSLHSLHSNVLR